MNSSDPFDVVDRMFDQLRRSMMDAQMGALPGRDATALPGGDELATLDGGFDVDGAFGVGGSRVRMEPTDDGYLAIADLPGFEREDLTVTVDDGLLTVRGTTDASTDDGTTVSRQTRRVSEFIRLPETVEVDAIEATYRNGVLELTLPTETAPGDDAHVIDLE
jgi:HSP20 family protein